MHGKEYTKEDENIKGYAFIPMFELYNQHLLPDIYHSEENYPLEFTKGSFILKADRNFELGQELYMPYKRKSNHQLLMDSGSTITNNIHDRLKITKKNSNENKTYLLSPVTINEDYLNSFSGSSNPLIKYRKGIQDKIINFKHALRHQRRRLKILEVKHIKLTFNISAAEKLCAYHALALIDRNILKSFVSSLHLL